MSRDLITKAIQRARQAPDAGIGLRATRRVLTHGDNRTVGGTSYEWHVAFDAQADRFMTVITDEDVRAKSDKEIADLILGCWDNDWDDILQQPHVGDYTVGSPAFSQRDKEKWSRG